MLKTLKNLTKDTVTYGFANVLGQIIGFLLLPLYTSYLTIVDYGVMAMITFISMFFAPLANMGVTNAIFRRFNLHQDVDLQITSLSIGSIFVFFSSFIWLGIALFFVSDITTLLVDDLKYQYLVQISLVSAFFTSISQVFTVVLRAKRRVTQIALVRITELLITVGCTIYFIVVMKQGLEGVIKGALIGSVIGFFFQYLLCYKLIKFRLALGELKELLKYGLPFLPHRLFGFGSIFIGQFFIKEFIGLAETGLYNIALRFALPLSFIIGSVQSAWVPIKFQTHREEGENSALVFRQLISFYFIVISILFVGSVTVGPELLRLMTHPDYHSAVYLLPMVLLIPFSRGIYFMLGTGFEITNNTKPMPLISAAGLFVMIILSYALYEILGIHGIIIAMIASWLTMSVVMRYFAVKRFYVPINLKLIIVLFGAATLLSTTIYLIQGFSISVRIFSGMLIGGVCLIILIGLIGYNKDLKTLNVNKYPLFNKLNNFLLTILDFGFFTKCKTVFKKK